MEIIKNLYVYRLTIIAPAFCGLKEIALAAIELQSKNKTTVNWGSIYSNRTVTTE